MIGLYAGTVDDDDPEMEYRDRWGRTWHWMDGHIQSYWQWKGDETGGQPGGLGQDCAIMLDDGDDWHDDHCHSSQWYFMCEVAAAGR